MQLLPEHLNGIFFKSTFDFNNNTENISDNFMTKKQEQSLMKSTYPSAFRFIFPYRYSLFRLKYIQN